MNDLEKNILSVLNESLPDILDMGYKFTYADSVKVIQICKYLKSEQDSLIEVFKWNMIKDRILFLIDVLEYNSHIINRIEMCMYDGSDVQFSKKNKGIIRDTSYPVKYYNFTDIHTFGDEQEQKIDIIYIFLN